MEEGEGWGRDFADLRSRLAAALDATRQLENWARAQLVGNMPPMIGVLVDELSKAQSVASQLAERLHENPLALLIHGYLMPREAYYVLVALGVLGGRSYTGDAYNDFAMLHYEDSERRCVIDVGEPPPPGTIRIHFGTRPEEIRWERLRPEQREYFGLHLPEVAARFRREA